MTKVSAIEVRDAELPQDLGAVDKLWFAYLAWGNEEMQARHGVHHGFGATRRASAMTWWRCTPAQGDCVVTFALEEASRTRSSSGCD